jgi:integrase
MGRDVLRVPKQDPRELDFDQEDRLFAALRSTCRTSPASRCCRAGGSRKCGCCAGPTCIARSARRVKIKGGEIAQPPLTEDMLVLIANQPKVGPFVFTYVCQKSRKEVRRQQGGSNPARLAGERYSFTQWGWRKPWAAALKAAGIDELRFHDLRHTRGTRILRHTGNLAIAKKALAHRRSRRRCAMRTRPMTTFGAAWMHPSPELFPTDARQRAKNPSNSGKTEQCVTV